MAKIARLPHEILKSICEALSLDPDLTGRIQIRIEPDRIDVTTTAFATDALGAPLQELFQSTDWLRQEAHNSHAFEPTRCDTCGGQIDAPAHKNNGGPID